MASILLDVLPVPGDAKVDLSADANQFKMVKLDGTLGFELTGAGDVPAGVLKAPAPINTPCQVIAIGTTKVQAGAAIVAGARLTTGASGQVVTTSSSNPDIGFAIDAAAGAGEVIEIVLQAVNPPLTP